MGEGKGDVSMENDELEVYIRELEDFVISACEQAYCGAPHRGMQAFSEARRKFPRLRERIDKYVSSIGPGEKGMP